ncbi:MAG: hypothetical protein M3O34_01635 [Chloroflexota bacterium]|nr:hypothetical protein [Chloroflexota bacterium]
MAGPIAVFYEHPEWFRPLFAAIDRRRLPFVHLHADRHHFDPSATKVPYSLVVNRMSASSYLRGHANAIFQAQQYLEYLEEVGVPVVNGARAYALDTSKARQLWLMTRLGLPHPRSRVANSADGLVAAAGELAFPLIVKPSLGGSGALMRRFDDPELLRAAQADGSLAGILGVDHTAIVQEFHRPRDGAIVRVEVLDDELLYAIRITREQQDDFNLCPADICRAPSGDPDQVTDPRRRSSPAPAPPAPAPSGDRALDVRPAEAPKRSMTIEVADPPTWVVDGVRAIFRAAKVDVGGVEYLESERDGQVYLYDVNTLSNFVSDAPSLVGFDPFERFVDYVARRAGLDTREAVGARS